MLSPPPLISVEIRALSVTNGISYYARTLLSNNELLRLDLAVYVESCSLAHKFQDSQT